MHYTKKGVRLCCGVYSEWLIQFIELHLVILHLRVINVAHTHFTTETLDIVGQLPAEPSPDFALGGWLVWLRELNLGNEPFMRRFPLQLFSMSLE